MIATTYLDHHPERERERGAVSGGQLFVIFSRALLLNELYCNIIHCNLNKIFNIRTYDYIRIGYN